MLNMSFYLWHVNVLYLVYLAKDVEDLFSHYQFKVFLSHKCLTFKFNIEHICTVSQRMSLLKL